LGGWKSLFLLCRREKNPTYDVPGYREGDLLAMASEEEGEVEVGDPLSVSWGTATLYNSFGPKRKNFSIEKLA